MNFATTSIATVRNIVRKQPGRRALRAALAAVIVAGMSLAASAEPAAGAHVEEALTVMHQRFGAADGNHDGRITREEARQRMPFVYRNFDAIDTAHAGAVTMAQIEAYAARQAMARRGAR